MISKHFLPRPEDLPQLQTAEGQPIPFALIIGIDPMNLEAEYESHAAWQATISYAEARAQADAATANRVLERLKAKKFFEKKQTLAAAGAKPTNDMISNAICLDEEVVELEDAAAAADERAAVLNAALKSYISRRDMLVGIGANARAEQVRVYRPVGSEED